MKLKLKKSTVLITAGISAIAIYYYMQQQKKSDAITPVSGSTDQAYAGMTPQELVAAIKTRSQGTGETIEQAYNFYLKLAHGYGGQAVSDTQKAGQILELPQTQTVQAASPNPNKLLVPIGITAAAIAGYYIVTNS